MIIPVSVRVESDGKPDMHLAVTSEFLNDVNDVRDLRNSLLSLLSCCLSSEDIAQHFNTNDLWWLTKLIDATTTSANSEKGGEV
jgi:hypothetical protein